MTSTHPSNAAVASLLFGLLCAPFGLAVGVFVAATATGTGYGAFALWAPLAAFFTSALLWRLLVERRRRGVVVRRRWIAALAGAVSGALSHWLCWYLLLLWSNVTYWLAGTPTSSLGEPPVDPITALAAALVFSAWSLAFFGVVTVPAGAGLAVIWHSWLGRRERRSLPSPSDERSRRPA